MIPRGRLFRKYVVVFVSLVSGALLTSGAIELYFSYRENKAALVDVQREKAAGAASRIESFVKEIERQIGWTTQPQLVAPAAALEQRRIDFLRLQNQVPAITELSHIDASGKEQLRVSRLMMDVAGSGADFSNDPRFLEARAGKTYFGPVYFRKESEPYMTIAMPQRGGGGVTVAEVNLKFIWDVVTQIKIGKAGRAFVVDGAGTLIAHPDISLVLQKTMFGSLDHVHAAVFAQPGAREVTIARDLQGRQVLTAHSTIAPLRWFVFVEQPEEEALEPVYASVKRTVVLEAIGVALSVLVSLVLARKMVNPIRALEAGAARIGAGDLGARIEVHTGDEIEALAEQFNRMTGQLQESYATLEHRVEERTRELSEALEQQTATAQVLGVISSSPQDLQPVFDSIVKSATRLCDAAFGGLLRVDGEVLTLAAGHNVSEAETNLLRGAFPLRVDAAGAVGRAVREGTVVQIHDFLKLHDPETEAGYVFAAAQPAVGYRTLLIVPMLREDVAIGVIVLWRQEVRDFTDKQIELVTTFADQAVIAIENVRLFTELQERNREVTEALERQTGTSEILRVISSSPTNVEPVFDAIAASAVRLCDAAFGALLRFDGEVVTLVAHSGEAPEELLATARGFPFRPRPGAGGFSSVLLDHEVAHVRDIREHAEWQTWRPNRIAATVTHYRTFLAVPLLREGACLGTINVWRREVAPFTDKQIELVKTFADQAVIAVENVRLFTELQERTRALTRSVDQLTALGEVSRAVSSTLDLDAVLDTIVSRAGQLSGADGCSIFEYDERLESFHIRATNVGGELLEAQRAVRIRRGEGILGRVAETRTPIQIPDISEEGAYQSPLRDTLTGLGYRALLALPLLREAQLVGGLTVSRRSPGEFPPETVELLRTFANQSVLAIENARLFREIDDKSRQLEVANQHKSEFLANMSHELRTPLNAIIGFSEVLIERMFGDLNDKQDEYLRDIYSSGRHLLSLINDILDLSKIEAGRMELDLGTFDLPTALETALTLVRGRADAHTIRLEMKVDDRLGDITADERKVKQILLNLLSNAVKFTPDGGRIGLRAAPADGSVEISVTDTGVGIAPDDQAMIFEEFRQARGDHAGKREGTGLGLALTKKFVELHGGQIWVKSEIGHGSTFTFTLPLMR